MLNKIIRPKKYLLNVCLSPAQQNMIMVKYSLSLFFYNSHKQPIVLSRINRKFETNTNVLNPKFKTNDIFENPDKYCVTTLERGKV